MSLKCLPGQRKSRDETATPKKTLLSDGDAGEELHDLVLDSEEESSELRLPSPFVSERMLNQIEHLMASREINSAEQADAYLQTLMGSGLERAWKKGPRRDPQWQAQELAYQAMETESASEAATLARKALSLDPDCVDALSTLAQVTADSQEELIAMLRRAVQAGERSLGPAFFKKNSGNFWGITRTRPYMRARFDLAMALLSAGRVIESAAHFEVLLELNPGDNQGVRDILLSLYLAIEEMAGVRRLLEEYQEDASALFSWARVLERYVARDLEGAFRALRQARRGNPHVEKYFRGDKPLPHRLPEYYSMGKEDEAQYCAFYLAPAWIIRRDAVNWLRRR